MGTVFIDGSSGEGGGQILRTSLTLSCITGKFLHIENIRSGRRNPGLARQHLSCVEAASKICGGTAKGASKGSQILDFEPGKICGGNYNFNIGSAGSATLVIQTVLPALFLADKPSTVTVTGGTHNPMAPPYDFFCETFLPAIAAAGFSGNCKLLRYGFFPAGGGKIVVDIQPWQHRPNETINLCAFSKNVHIDARIYTARLPAHIAERQRKLLLKSGLNIAKIEHIDITDSAGPGNCVMIRICNERTTIFTSFGQRGKPSEQVIDEVVKPSNDYIESGAIVDRFLADQLLIYMAMCCTFGAAQEEQFERASCFISNELSSHLKTNIEVIKEFLNVDFSTEPDGGNFKVSCRLV
jgi:RNA 3'-terminal phosphate cyclase (ATP)